MVKRILLYISIFALFTYGGWRFINLQRANAAVDSITSTQAPMRIIDATALQTKINAIIQQYSDLDIGVAVTDIQNEQTLNYGESAAFEAASVNKLITAIALLARVEQNQASLSDFVSGTTAQLLLQRMIVNSDNDAWSALNSYTTAADLKAYAPRIGLSSYDYSNNTIMARDIALLLTNLYQNRLLTKDHTNLLLGYMKQANEQNLIAAAAPAGAQVYHKAGWLDDRLHDAAIVDDGKHPYVLVIFSKSSGPYDQDRGENLFHSLTEAVNSVLLSN